MVKKETEPNSQSKYLSDSDSDDNETNPRLKTSIEERQYNTIPRSVIATHITLSYSKGASKSNHRERTTTSESQDKQTFCRENKG